MAKFFEHKVDLANWVMNQKDGSSAAISLIASIKHKSPEDDAQNVIRETCESIHRNENIVTAVDVLTSVLSNYNLMEATTKEATSDKIIKTAQLMRDPGLYNEYKVRICPKLPKSIYNGIVSSYVCATHCAEGIILDEDPSEPICGESLWRRHIMDKFSREFQDSETGHYVGGYIKNRFVSLADKEPAYESMMLAPVQRGKDPKQHHYSTEARLENSRGEEINFVKANRKNAVQIKTANHEYDEKYHRIYSDVVSMIENGKSNEDIYGAISDDYGVSITTAAKFVKMASSKLNQYDRKLYAFQKKK